TCGVWMDRAGLPGAGHACQCRAAVGADRGAFYQRCLAAVVSPFCKLCAFRVHHSIVAAEALQPGVVVWYWSYAPLLGGFERVAGVGDRDRVIYVHPGGAQ